MQARLVKWAALAVVWLTVGQVQAQAAEVRCGGRTVRIETPEVREIRLSPSSTVIVRRWSRERSRVEACQRVEVELLRGDVRIERWVEEGLSCTLAGDVLFVERDGSSDFVVARTESRTCGSQVDVEITRVRIRPVRGGTIDVPMVSERLSYSRSALGEGSACAASADCGGALTCQRGVCSLPRCTEHSQCGFGQACVSRRCVRGCYQRGVGCPGGTCVYEDEAMATRGYLVCSDAR